MEITTFANRLMSHLWLIPKSIEKTCMQFTHVHSYMLLLLTRMVGLGLIQILVTQQVCNQIR